MSQFIIYITLIPTLFQKQPNKQLKLNQQCKNTHSALVSESNAACDWFVNKTIEKLSNEQVVLWDLQKWADQKHSACLLTGVMADGGDDQEIESVIVTSFVTPAETGQVAVRLQSISDTENTTSVPDIEKAIEETEFQLPPVSPPSYSEIDLTADGATQIQSEKDSEGSQSEEEDTSRRPIFAEFPESVRPRRSGSLNLDAAVEDPSTLAEPTTSRTSPSPTPESRRMGDNTCLFCGLAVATIAALLVVILVPMSFSDLEYYEVRINFILRLTCSCKWPNFPPNLPD